MGQMWATGASLGVKKRGSMAKLDQRACFHAVNLCDLSMTLLSAPHPFVVGRVENFWPLYDCIPPEW